MPTWIVYFSVKENGKQIKLLLKGLLKLIKSLILSV